MYSVILRMTSINRIATAIAFQSIEAPCQNRILRSLCMEPHLLLCDEGPS